MMDTLRLRFASCFDKHPYATQLQTDQKCYKVSPLHFILSSHEFKGCGIGKALELTLVFNRQGGNTTTSKAIKSSKSIQFKGVSDGQTTIICEKSVSGNQLYESGAQMVVDAGPLDRSRCIEIVLSGHPLTLLNSTLSLDFAAETMHKPPFGLNTLTRFLQDHRTFDTEYHALQTTSCTKPRTVRAHRAVAKTNSVLGEYIRKQSRPKAFKVEGVDGATMQLVINHIYLGQIEGPGYFSGVVPWPHLYQAAQRFRISRLGDLALQRHMASINVSNVLDELFEWAHQHKELEERLIEFAAANVHQVFARLGCQDVEEFKKRLAVYKSHAQFSRIVEAIVSRVLGPVPLGEARKVKK
ncbi:hypothetical protein MVEG_06292 [Podila verticillata NRRL 6337]|nr:hypothetical protein MVEG_06292 [Podila verticillata NRRL 6337]